MNSVHEHCPNSYSETVLSPKTGSKLSQVHSAPNLTQPAGIGTPRHGRAWPCRRPLRPCRGRVAGTDGRVASAPAPCRRHSAARLASMSWLGYVVLRHSPALPLALWSQYTLVYCNTMPISLLSCHNTLSVL